MQCYLFITLFHDGVLKQLIANKNQPLNMITKKNNSNNNKNECIRLHRHIHVWHIKQPQSISLKLFMLLLNSQTDLLDCMQLGTLFQIRDPRKCTESVPYYVDLAGDIEST